MQKLPTVGLQAVGRHRCCHPRCRTTSGTVSGIRDHQPRSHRRRL